GAAAPRRACCAPGARARGPGGAAWAARPAEPPSHRQHAAMLAALATSRQHSRDRPRFHLRHAAMLALASLRRRGIANAADEHYQEVLIGLIDENSSSEKDLDRFYRLQRTWPAPDHRPN